ncbi:MAG: hypothetical protein H6706_16920 [Myxococcales bacterium]|nr:hypothetical protein [Myxococcales bacterium]
MKDDKKPAPEQRRKRTYEKPGFITSLAFERQALSCAGCLNQAMAPPAFCAMQS